MSSPAHLSPSIHPPRRRGYQRTWYSIPPPQRQWRKRDHGSLKRKPPEPKGIPQSSSPEGHHNSTTPTSGCIVPPHNLHRSTFSFSESRTAFSFAVQKKKWFWPPLGKQKTNRKAKHPAFPQKKKPSPPQGIPHHPCPPSPLSTFSLSAPTALFSHPGTGAPISPAFSIMLPASVSRYHTTANGQRNTV